MTIEDIAAILEERAPKERAAEFDNVGLLIGRRGRRVSKILTALDCTNLGGKNDD